MCYFSLIPLTNICCIPLRYWARYRANSGESITYTVLALIDNTNLCVKDDIKYKIIHHNICNERTRHY